MSFKKILQIAITVNGMTDEQLAKRMEELKVEIASVEALGLNGFDLNLEAMIILHRLIEEGKLGNCGEDIDKE